MTNFERSTNTTTNSEKTKTMSDWCDDDDDDDRDAMTRKTRTRRKTNGRSISIDDGDDISMDSNDNDDDDDRHDEHWNNTNEKENHRRHDVDRISTETHDGGVEQLQETSVVDGDRDSLESTILDWNLSSFDDDDCDQLNWKVRLSCGSIDVGCCPVTNFSFGPRCFRQDSVRFSTFHLSSILPMSTVENCSTVSRRRTAIKSKGNSKEVSPEDSLVSFADHWWNLNDDASLIHWT